MYKFKKSLIALIGLASLMTVGTVVMPHTGYGSSGTAASNAPAAQTQNVNVVNTPTVKSQQDGVWNVGLVSGSNVGISGTPSVNVANTPTVGIDPASNGVQVGNDSAHPVLVRDLDNPARQPFEASVGVNITDGLTFGNGALDSSAVPAGKRLVIEHISALTSLPSGQKVEDIQVLGLRLQEGGGASAFQTWLGADLKATTGGLDRFITSQPVRLYIDSGATRGFSPVQVAVDRDGVAGFGQCIMNISGYLVDVP